MIAKGGYLWVVFIALAVGIFLGRGSLSGREQYSLFIYPKKVGHVPLIMSPKEVADNEGMAAGVFEDLEEARSAARSWMNYFSEGDYIIGVGKQKNWNGIPVFKEKVR
jgi:hypothetical protein